MATRITNADVRSPMVFLSLAPTTSECFPTSQNYQPAKRPEARRSSSLSSNDSAKLRFLKLGPVHYGEHRDEHKADYHEVAIE
ncbi:hypothetical protein JX265_001577 [Neoarthrinium moseri]|uniref:Uncharacterized protein n=1 Tax=Neoarthrinium moseri TaxID=1658444 RepID=A0A9P9WVV5_9PEZI|nr:uncharacterized protein JN550_003972 [Neoarthrinium moseri]KAI1844591.1 hypothetical protein JX266_009264 [Neoarthrinium moseri]KAI1872253.1 hypothetical protein JN550_003972 [Neoarthrinium moseri]KAI1879956.1 hypothetical protein JX265_001577 [Neoarthrinium moseri]